MGIFLIKYVIQIMMGIIINGAPSLYIIDFVSIHDKLENIVNNRNCIKYIANVYFPINFIILAITLSWDIILVPISFRNIKIPTEYSKLGAF
jgi:hypothetical protein